MMSLDTELGREVRVKSQHSPEICHRSRFGSGGWDRGQKSGVSDALLFTPVSSCLTSLFPPVEGFAGGIKEEMI